MKQRALFFVSIACFKVLSQLNIVEFDDAPGVDAQLDVGVTDLLGGAGVVALLDVIDDEAGECSRDRPLISATTFCALSPRGILFRMAMYGSTRDFPNSIKNNRRRSFFCACGQCGLLAKNITIALTAEMSNIFSKNAKGQRNTFLLHRYVPTISSSVSTAPLVEL